MAAPALADVLVDFASRRPLPAAGPSLAHAESTSAARLEEEWAAKLQAERARVEAEIRAELEAQHEAKIDEIEERHRAETERLVGTLAADAGERLSAGLAEAESRIGDLTGRVVARLLSASMTAELRENAIDALQKRIRAAIRDDEAVTIKVEGPPSLQAALQTVLADRASQMRFVETATPDLRVTIDETIFETRLADWSHTLTELLS